MGSLANRFGRLPTGIKIFSVITLALLPLGLIALFVSLAASRTADLQREAGLRVALSQSTRQLSAELSADVRAMSRATRTISTGMRIDEICTQLAKRLSRRPERATPIAVFNGGNAPACGTKGFIPSRPALPRHGRESNAQANGDHLDVIVSSPTTSAIVVARYSVATLATLTKPSTMEVPFTATLTAEGSSLPLHVLNRGVANSAETISAPVGVLGLTLSVSAADVPARATETLLTFLPLLMWASAAVIGFVVVDRLLIRPLDSLRRAVASHTPGTEFHLPSMRTPAREIRELGETFAKFNDEIGQHERRMAKALADQTKATREVHHRVKNNLQVIASLISLHARGAQAPDAITAYAAIQRRVDALSIVHRNHYAELDSAGGIDVKGLLAELAANLRATATPVPAVPAIAINAARFGVTQDNAVAIAFLITELVELSMAINPGAEIKISVFDSEISSKAHLSVASLALQATPALTERLSGRYARVLEAISRQLRAPLAHSGASGRFEIDFAILNR